MDWNLKAPSRGFKESEQEPNSNTGPIGGSSSLGGHGNKGDFSVDSKLGHVVFGNASVDNLPPTMVSGSSKRARAVSTKIQAASCQVNGCQEYLCKAYHMRHKVCERHSKTPEVEIQGHKQRFCQQCSRFHLLEEFDDGKRSCRKRLDEHNRRRRRPQPEPLSLAWNFLSNYQGLTRRETDEVSHSSEGKLMDEMSLEESVELEETPSNLREFLKNLDQGFQTPDKHNSSKPDLNSRGEEDSELLRMLLGSDATFSISDRERTSGTAPDGGVSYMEESMMPLNEMGEVVTKQQKLSPEDKEPLIRRETDEVLNSSDEELMEETWSEELEENPSDPRTVVRWKFLQQSLTTFLSFTS